MLIKQTDLPRWKKGLSFVVFIYIGMYVAWLFFGRELAKERFLIGNISMLFTTLLAASIAGWTTNHSEQKTIRSTWQWLTTGLFIWSAADLASLVSAYWGGTQSVITILHDLILLLGFIPIWGGLIRYPRKRLIIHNRIHQWINITVTTTALVTLVWIVIIIPLQTASYPLVRSSWLAMYLPIADLFSLILLVIIFLLTDVHQSSAPLSWFSMGIAAYLFSDLTYARLLPQAGYEIGSPLDMGWIIGDAFFLFAAFAQMEMYTPAVKTNTHPFFERVQSLLPFLCIISLGLYDLFDWWLTGTFNSLGLWVAFLLSLAMIVRQAMLAGEVSIRQYASLVNSIAEATFVCDEKGSLQLINPAFVSLTGIPMANSDNTIQHIFTNINHWQITLEAAKNEGWNGELTLIHSDGHETPVSLSLRPIYPKEDRRLVIAGTLFDLSEQKHQQNALELANRQINEDRAELELLNTQLEQMVIDRTQDLRIAYQQLEQQNITLQKLDQIKSDFVSMVSHELRAPLTNINGGIELLLSGHQQPPPTQLKLQLVQKEINRLTRFVETILDLSAMDAGKLPLYPMPLDIKSFIHQFKDIFQNQQYIERIQWFIPDNLPPVNADDHALHSILFHLLDNAIKYAPEGKITVLAEVNSLQMQIHIEDEGPGIAEENMPYLFERFYRPNSHDSQTVYGYGLGLYIVKRLSEAMNGSIMVKNRVPNGAIFTLKLPLFQEGMDV
jgi:PAS domain S-box-containing protein